MMKRRNKSNKVPNVKLRPAQEGPITRLQRRESSIWAEDSQLGSDDTSVIDLCPRPFKGVVICATGVVDKPTLFKQALELGATSTSAFTDRVTHLVAVNHGGAKYNCALERKIPILTPSWITDSYQVWLRGDDVDLHESTEKHRLSIFSSVVLCPSGITDIIRRTQINKLVTENGGQYLKNLERPVRVTHLLCSGDEETDKMRYAEKFNSRGEANVHLVWEEWFWDSLEFGGRFDEQTYQVRRPRPERKSLPEETTSPASTFPGFTNQPEETNSSKAQEPSLQDEAEEELANVQRLPAATLHLWGTLLNRRGYEISDGSVIKSPSKAPRPLLSKSAPEVPEKDNGSLISQFRRSNSFAPARPEAAAPGRPQPFRRSRTTTEVNLKGDVTGSFMASAQPGQESNGEASTSAAVMNSGFFAGLKFTALGEAKSPSVRAAVEENGGRMMMGLEDEDVDFVIVRLVSGSKLFQEEADEHQKSKYRTECWLERCVFEDRVCPPDDHITFLPLSIASPVPGAEKISLSFSGLDQAEAMWITRLLRALGMKLEQFFSRRSTHLLCPLATGPKFEKACEWETPVITLQWLATIATTGVIPSAEGFLVPGLPRNDNRFPTEELMDVDIDPKGKGKAVDKGKGRVLAEDSTTETISSDIGDVILPQRTPTSRLDTPLSNLGPRRPSVSPSRTPLEVTLFGRVDGPLATSTQRYPPPTTPRQVERRPDIFPRKLPSVTPPKPVGSPSRTRSSPAIQKTPRHYHTLSKVLSAPTASSNLGRQPTPREIERERRQIRIPSSKSPSPLKIPRQPQNHVPMDSPTRMPRDVAKALEDNITTLLGKRQSPEGEPPPPAARPGKRQRPQRPTRLQSRQPSAAQLADIPYVPLPAYDDSMNPFNGVDELNVLDTNVEESIRVTYEDPKQQEETKRLMSLLNVGSKVEAAASGGSQMKNVGGGSIGTRKSARIAGF